jgi:hypothetical protein
MSGSLSTALTTASDRGLSRRIGTVKTTAPLVVTTGNGDISPTGRLSSYTPAVGNVVLMLVDDRGAAIVVGRIVAP